MTDWHEYFREYRKNMDLVKRGITAQYLDEDGVLVVETIEEPPAFEVRLVEDLDPATLVRSPKAVITKVVDLGWDLISLRRSTLWYFDAFMKGNGAVSKRTGEQKLAGDLKTAAHEETELYMVVASTKWKCGFIASWNGGSFDRVVMYDVMVGFPIPIYRSYRGLNEKGEGKTLYVDDGEDFVTHALSTEKFGDFTEWLNGWLGVINPAKAPVEKKPEAPTEEPLTKGIWIEHD